MGGELKIDGAYSVYNQVLSAPASIPPNYIFGRDENERLLRAANAISNTGQGNQQFRTGYDY
jgi:hypothetical protein